MLIPTLPQLVKTHGLLILAVAMQNTTYILFTLAAAIGIGGLVWAFLIQQRLNKLTQNTNEEKLEDIVAKAFAQAASIDSKHNNLDSRLSAIETFNKNTHTTHAFIAFDAYGDTAAKQSNTLCVLNISGNGFIITNLYARERTRVFMRPINNFNCELNLLPEEQEALTQASSEAKNKAF